MRTAPFKRAAAFSGSRVTWNLGRLYSSTLNQVAPSGSPSTRSTMGPVTPVRGGVKLPANEPKSLQRCFCRPISFSLLSCSTTVTSRPGSSSYRSAAAEPTANRRQIPLYWMVWPGR